MSQPSLASKVMQQGNQVVLNGRALAIAWGQWQTPQSSVPRLGVRDGGLVQLAGVELLDSSDHRAQPVQWFAQTGPLPTRLTGTFRLLDITGFAQQAGWQLQISGPTLNITTPAAQVLAVRHGKQAWGDRVVLELDRPAPWQVDPQAQELVLTLNARTDAKVLQSLPSPGTQGPTLKLETNQNQTVLRLGIPASLRPRIWSLANPNRLIIDIRPDALVDRSIQWAAGLRWRSQLVQLGNDRFPVTWLELDPNQPTLRLKPILPNAATMQGTAPLARTAQQAGVAAAINGGFFNRNNQLPLGAVRLDNRWLSGPILNRGAIGWNSLADTRIDRLTLQETLITATGQRLPIAYLNSAYPGIGLVRYTPAWGPTYRPLTAGEVVITVQADRVTAQQPLTQIPEQPIPIPIEGYLLVLRSNAALAPSFPLGAPLRIDSPTLPAEFARNAQIMAAGPLLIQNRQVVLDPTAEKFSTAFAAERASRSAIGQTANGTLLLVAVHNRVNGVGPSLTELAQLMQQLGAIAALNLDGGSSTGLYLGGQLVDRLPRTAASVHSGIGIYLTPDP